MYLLNNQGPETQQNNGTILIHTLRFHGNFEGIPPQSLKDQ